ncbi:aldehyde dehydrogenase [Salipaludibacillus keqinensis]|uniref:3-sulfolactaldehyde dehydrogenase n=1 Tax=Salipaludibacillus keqinensis TaxID=2045207 RepID=A0A323TDJ3_9BACI|nr:aldehyde dehydrogenase family protein [Salipaludibacillus keqinensis]PYZ92716.1 aldehyde dehydrogenase [Salipaludibacillus keqinensis]
MTKDYAKQYINGKWIEGHSEKSLTNKDPFNEDIIFEMKSASEQDLNEAYTSAQQAQKKWSTTAPGEKQQLLESVAQVMVKRKDEIIDWLVKEAGSTMTKANLEFSVAHRIVKESASFPYRVKGKIMDSDIPGKENRVYMNPKGVVGVIGPWNFPFHLSMRSVAPAIATGNTVVLKPASETIVTSGTLIADIFAEAGAPDGVLNVIAGRGSEIGDAFVQHSVAKVISFTGSTEVGRHIAKQAGEQIKETALELGGNNVLIVLEDADLEAAAESAAFGKFMHQGQICMSINRILVHNQIHDEFVDLFKKKVESLQTGDPSDEKTAIGPLINRSQVDRIQKDLDDSVNQGAEEVLGGKVEGNLLHPVILTHVTNDMPIAKNEIFGPVAPIISFESEEEAIKLANQLPYGLSGAIHTKDLHHGVETAQKIETGMIHINDQPVNDEAHMAFGGEKDSGLGRFGGEWVLNKFTTEKWVSVQKERRAYPFFE